MNKTTPLNAWNFITAHYDSISPINFEVASEVYDDLVLMYSSPDRLYHNLSHITEMLNKIDEMLRIYAFDNIDETRAELYLASLFHDVVYTPSDNSSTKSSDELMSADAAIIAISRMGIDSDVTARAVHELISLTTNHKLNVQSDIPKLTQSIFIDADMAILGADDTEYSKYRQGIADEYSHVPICKYISARSTFLEHLQEKKAIFYTEYMTQVYNEQAKVNITSELSLLDQVHAEELINTTQGQ